MLIYSRTSIPSDKKKAKLHSSLLVDLLSIRVDPTILSKCRPKWPLIVIQPKIICTPVFVYETDLRPLLLVSGVNSSYRPRMRAEWHPPFLEFGI